MSSDMTGRKVRQPGRAGERYREARERRIRESRERRQAFWAERIKRARTPLEAFRVMTDRVSTAVIQRERQAAVAADRAKGKPGATQAQARLDAARREISADLMWLAGRCEDIAIRHETHRV
jgi:hypothetical protein